MTPGVDDLTADLLVDLAERDGIDPLGLLGRRGFIRIPQGMRPLRIDEARRSAFDAMRRDGHARGSALAHGGTVPIDDITRDLLLHKRLHPGVAAAIADAAATRREMATFVCRRGCAQHLDRTWAVVIGEMRWTARPSTPGVADGGRNAVVPAMPETLMRACVGRRLHEIVDHPALRGHDLVVREAVRTADRTLLRLDPEEAA